MHRERDWNGGNRMKRSPRQLEQLFQDLEDGCISASDSRKLSAILRTERDARLRYCEHMAFSSAMNTKAEAEASLGSWKPMDTDGRRLLFHSFLAAAAAVLLLAAIAGFHPYQPHRSPACGNPGSGRIRLVGRTSGWEVIGTGNNPPGDGNGRCQGGLRGDDLGIPGRGWSCRVPARVKFPSTLHAEVEQGCLWIDTAKGSEQMAVSGGGLDVQGYRDALCRPGSGWRSAGTACCRRAGTRG